MFLPECKKEKTRWNDQNNTDEAGDHTCIHNTIETLKQIYDLGRRDG